MYVSSLLQRISSFECLDYGSLIEHFKFFSEKIGEKCPLFFTLFFTEKPSEKFKTFAALFGLFQIFHLNNKKG
jgi:hypothetical protein